MLSGAEPEWERDVASVVGISVHPVLTLAERQASANRHYGPSAFRRGRRMRTPAAMVPPLIGMANPVRCSSRGQAGIGPLGCSLAVWTEPL